MTIYHGGTWTDEQAHERWVERTRRDDLELERERINGATARLIERYYGTAGLVQWRNIGPEYRQRAMLEVEQAEQEEEDADDLADTLECAR
jgi:hypothetical protein